MKLGFGKFLTGPFNATTIENCLQRLTAAISGTFAVEHHDDGTHANVTADTLALGGDPEDGSWSGNVSGSLIPIAEDSDLGAVVTGKDGSDDLDHPWRHLRLAGRLFIGAAWETTVIDGVPFFEFDGNDLVLDLEGQAAFEVTGATAGTLRMTLGNLTYDGTIQADEAVVAGTGFLERARSVALGEWTAVAFNAANFTASAGTWTVDSGDQGVLKYMLVGKTMYVVFQITTTDVSNAGVSLRIAIPGGFTCATATRFLYQASDAGTQRVGLGLVSASATFIELFAQIDATGFVITAADNTSVFGECFFEVV